MSEDKKDISAPDTTFEKLQKELRINRICTCIASVLMLCILAGGIIISLQFKTFTSEITPALEQIASVDFQSVNRTLDTIHTTLNAVDWEQLSAQLNALDINSINTAIAGLDTEELSKSLATLNDIVASLEEFGETIKSALSKFSFTLPGV